MFALIDLHKRTWGRQLHDLGISMSMAFADPAALKTLKDDPAELDMDSIPAMLKAPKKKAANG